MEIVQRFFWFCLYCFQNLLRPMHIRGLLSLRRSIWQVRWFPPNVAPDTFPSVDRALPAIDETMTDPSGLLAVGGQVTADSMLAALHAGIYPCNLPHLPTKWWAPPARMVLFPEELHIQKTVLRLVRNDRFRITFNSAFNEVIEACSQPRRRTTISWIATQTDALKELHRRGHAFSVEAWDKDDKLVGGLYGLVSGRIMSIESFFTVTSHASKVALIHLCAHLRHWRCPLVDLQLPSAHLESLGCRPIPREQYMAFLAEAEGMPGEAPSWKIEVRPANDGAPATIEGASENAACRSGEAA